MQANRSFDFVEKFSNKYLNFAFMYLYCLWNFAFMFAFLSSSLYWVYFNNYMPYGLWIYPSIFADCTCCCRNPQRRERAKRFAAWWYEKVFLELSIATQLALYAVILVINPNVF